MRNYAELAEMAMQLARIAAADAIANHNKPPPEPPQPEPPPPEPQQPQPETKPASAATRPIAAISLRAPTCPAIDPAVLFTRLAAIARDCMAQESRLAAGLPPNWRPAATPPSAGRRRAALQHAARRVLENHPDRTELLQLFETHLDEELSGEDAHLADNFCILHGFCMHFGIEPDPALLPPGFAPPENPFTRARSPP